MCASAHAVGGQVLRYTASGRVTPLAAKFCGTRPVDVLFQMDSGKTRTMTCSSGARQETGNVLSCYVTRAKRFREEFEREGVEAFALFVASKSGCPDCPAV